MKEEAKPGNIELTSEDVVAFTSRLIAALRAYESRREDGLFQDPFAELLVRRYEGSQSHNDFSCGTAGVYLSDLCPHDERESDTLFCSLCNGCRRSPQSTSNHDAKVALGMRPRRGTTLVDWDART